MPHTCNFLKFGSEPGEQVNNQRKIAEIRRGYHISSAVNGEYKIHGNEIKGAVPWHSDEEYSDLKKISEKDSMSLESTFAQTSHDTWRSQFRASVSSSSKLCREDRD